MKKFNPTLGLVRSQIVSSEGIRLFRRKISHVEGPLPLEKGAQSRREQVQDLVQLCC